MSSSSQNQPTRVEIVDSFLISSVATIIVIRAVLALTGYPQLGGGAFHIAHMLWGGLALAAALLISLLSRQENRELLALLGGVGFGFFIDEIGKFVTADNNYFYDGSFLLMYLILLLGWLICRLIVTRNEKTSLFLPAVWPRRRIEQLLVVVWAIAQIIGMPLLAYNLRVSGIFAVIHWVAISVFIMSLIFGLTLLVRNDIERAASVLRLASFIAILTVLPLLYYLNPLFALADTLASVLLMVGLSEVSVKQLAGRLVAVFSNRS